MKDKTFCTGSGIALIIGAILMFVTMVLHPAGGGIDHLQSISTVIIVTHSIAIISVPITLVGFWGLSKLLDIQNIWTISAFSVIAVGLISVMMAGILNGLALPFYVSGISEAMSEEGIHKSILRYNFAFNQALTYVYMMALAIAILIWSARILQTSVLNNLIAYFGILLSLAGIIIFLSGTLSPDLLGFRVFVFSSVAWIILTGILMIRWKEPD